MLKRYEITRQSKLLAVINFLLASFIVYTLNSIVVYYMNVSVQADNIDSPYVVRVVANSNNEEDQQIKQEVASSIQRLLQKQQNQPMELVAAELYTMLEKNYPQTEAQIAMGPQLIPPKIVDNRLYPQRKQTAIVVTLGSGRGDNWFCTVFPNTCEPALDEDPPSQSDEKADRPWLFKHIWDAFFQAE